MNSQILKEVNDLADFVLFAQRSCIFDLATELNKKNLNYPQFFLLTYLAGEDFLTMSDVAKKIGHSTAAATGLVDRLEAGGYVKREASKEDRRKMMVHITKKGVELVAGQRQSIVESLAESLVEMEEDSQIFKRARKNLSKRELI